jgi:hypothetical protein
MKDLSLLRMNALVTPTESEAQKAPSVLTLMHSSSSFFHYSILCPESGNDPCSLSGNS